MLRVRSAASLLLLCALTALAACGDDEKQGIDKIRIDGASAIDEGQTLALTAVALDAGGVELGGFEFTWISSDPEIASVDVTGLVRAERFGKVTITASASGVTGKASIDIRELAVSSLEIADAPVEIPIDGERKLEAVLRAENGTLLKGRPVVWSSSDPTVIEVSSAGEARGLARGTAELTATLGDRSDTAPAATVFRFVHLAAGAIHGCGLTNKGAAWCWGGNDHGELGGDGQETASPRRVASEKVWRQIAAGDSWTCALTEAGAAWCWGDVEGVSAFSEPKAVEVPALATLAVGARHACGITMAGATYCWGKNDHGQLGAGDDAPAVSAQGIAVAGSHRFESIVAGGSSTCALDDQNRAWCWGADDRGQLGRGEAGADARAPVQGQGERRC
ncbi:MAG TPA: Ig-like domain-containing protein, partial [Vulgatibacter sp.]